MFSPFSATENYYILIDTSTRPPQQNEMARHSDDEDNNERKRHRSHSHKSRRHDRDRDRKYHKRSDEDEGKSGDDKRRLTDEEERLYEKARAFVQHQQREDDRHDGRHKKESRRDRAENSGSDDSSDRRRRRHKGTSDGHHKSHRRKEHKHRKRDQERDKHKKSKHHRRNDRDHNKHDKQRLKSSSVDTSKLIPLGSILSHPPTEALDPSLHYFSHNPHLRLYLYRAHGIYFEDLSSDDARSHFEQFVKQYNAGRLEEAYYNPKLPQEALDQCLRTKHQWKFRTNQVEEEKLNMVKEGVRKQTEYDKGASVQNIRGDGVMSTLPMTTEPTHDTKDNQVDDHDKGPRRLEEKAAQRQSDKKYRERIKIANEEMDPRHFGKPSSGWERQQEKKRQRSNATHGAYQDREDVIAGGDLDDDAIYGDGEVSGSGGGGARRRRDLSYEEAVSKERQRREKREAEMAAKVEDAKRKEEEKRREMLAMLGLSGVDAGKKITIAPRQDGA
ncbi:hypothetical protein HJC23_009531 [Cyclotella cryptica]|uniref:Uncharacterized protein n=1 Tax=Cyclotella cryptica TaxID=29204 RepID=A0ABD3Q5F5_9STRA|eukprot:CCRYP_008849-RA/>CCRYP_008849-RA protein AED:0.02 eAED:-0.02 QI:0/-1/0/1/-1/1/1/0/500